MKSQSTLWAHRATALALFGWAFACTCATAGALTLPPILSDGVVFQRGQPIRLWGQAAPKERISIALAGSAYRTEAGTDGRWAISLPALNAIHGDLIIQTSSGDVQTIRKPLLGQVWVCGGQSNMAWPLKATDGANAIGSLARGEQPMHLYRSAAGRLAQRPQVWQTADQATAPEFSALCYLVGRGISEKLKEPVGLIDVSIGATPLAAWTPSKHPASFDFEKAQYRPRLRAQASYAFEASVRPVTPFSTKGLLWYQGEADANLETTNFASKTAETLMAWRNAFEQPDWPVIAVQIPGNTAAESQQGWQEIQTEQKKLDRLLPNAHVVDNSDLSFDRLHPRNKLITSRRVLSRLLSTVYPE